MTRSTPNLKLKAAWQRATPAAERWQAVQPLLSRNAATAASSWTRRSRLICNWHALPASVSALTPIS